MNDIGVDSDSEGRIARIWLEVSNFRMVMGIGANARTSTELKGLQSEGAKISTVPENLTQDIFTERMERQLKRGEGQAFDVLTAIQRKPGMSREEICDAVGATRISGAVGETLVVLEKRGRIFSDKKGGKRRYFPK